MLSKYNDYNEAGIDEAGRGCWWGPVCAAAVIWKEDLTHDFLTDSKKLSEKKRNLLYPWIKENCYYGIGMATSIEIDNFGILNATKMAIKRALEELEKKYTPSSIIIDGINWSFDNNFNYNFESIVKGDAKYYSIAAASVLAKVTRDNYCLEKSKLDNFKKYYFEKHKGYGTKLHHQMIDKYGPTKEHRFSFKPISLIN